MSQCQYSSGQRYFNIILDELVNYDEFAFADHNFIFIYTNYLTENMKYDE